MTGRATMLPPIDPDVRRAHTLPGRAYTDPAVFDAARERVFARSWNAAAGFSGHAVEPFTLLPGVLDEPLVLTRDDWGVERCLSNVCTHRGNLVVAEAADRKQLHCGYHGRCFGLDGRMRSMPGFEEVEDFPTRADDLPAASLARWGPVRFVSLAPERPFAEALGPLAERLAALSPDALPSRPTSVGHYEVAANWALYVDNYLEGFHVPFVHPELRTALTGYRYELFPHASLQVGLAATDDPVLPLPPGHVDHGARVAAYYAWIFPATMLNVYPWGLSLNVVEPLSVDRTRVTFASYVRDEDLLGAGAGSALDLVELQDEAVVEQVQRGVRARLYGRGRYSPEHERCVHHFHRMLAAALGDA